LYAPKSALLELEFHRDPSEFRRFTHKSKARLRLKQNDLYPVPSIFYPRALQIQKRSGMDFPEFDSKLNYIFRLRSDSWELSTIYLRETFLSPAFIGAINTDRLKQSP